MRFANRTDWKTSTNAINNAQEELRAKGVTVVDLTESNPTQCGFVYPPQLLNALTKPANLFYEPASLGVAAAREAVADYYQRRGVLCDTDHVLLTASTSEAYSFLLRLLVDTGAKVLIPKPSYPLFQFLLEINDVEFEYYPLVYSNGWQLDHHALIEQIDDKTRAIILVNPNNPTGSFLSGNDFTFLNELAVKHGLAIISDEVFVDYAWGKGDQRSMAGNTDALTFTLSGLSKVLALPQMKCGWVLASGPEPQVKEAMSRLEIIADTYLSVNTPVQQAMPQWLTHDQEIQEQIIQRVRANLQSLQQALDPHAQLLNTQGGWYATLKIPAVKSEERWVLDFLNEDHVLVHPGYFFDFERGTYIVISLILPTAVFKEAIERVMKRISMS